MILFSNKARPYHLGPFPLERLARDAGLLENEINAPRAARPEATSAADGEFAAAVDKYHSIFHSLRADDPAPARAPVPDDLARRSVDLKGAAYFLNASQVGICELADNCWLADATPLPHSHVIVVAVELPRTPEDGTLARSWVEGSLAAMAGFRAYEIGISIANQVQKMGFSAIAHDARSGDVDLERLAIMAGLGYRAGDRVLNPYLDDRFALCAVTTNYALATDLPLSPRAARKAKGISYMLGLGGATSGLERWRQNSRPTHLSKFAMETVDRVDEPTTLIIEDEVPRVPKRASFFDRAVHGDLGKKTQAERTRFAFKHPLAAAMVKQIMAMVPDQDGPVAEQPDAACSDAEENTRALKSLSYLLGAELTGICEVPRYAWYSHVDKGEPVECHHKYAVVMLIDQ